MNCLCAGCIRVSRIILQLDLNSIFDLFHQGEFEVQYDMKNGGAMTSKLLLIREYYTKVNI